MSTEQGVQEVRPPKVEVHLEVLRRNSCSCGAVQREPGGRWQGETLEQRDTTSAFKLYCSHCMDRVREDETRQIGFVLGPKDEESRRVLRGRLEDDCC